jgi:kynurenine formamidase
MSAIHSQTLSGESRSVRLTLRLVCREAGITEQTLHKKEHVELKKEVARWIAASGVKVAGKAEAAIKDPAPKLSVANRRLRGLAAEVLILRNEIIKLEAELRKLRGKAASQMMKIR